jgi:magnesium-transporting ATPase (P-type)
MQFTVLLLHCKITIYHFWIAINLAYLSTITHLLTMVALKSYFIEHRLSSVPRLILIGFNVGLFCYGAFVLDGLSYGALNHPSDATQLLACYYQGNRPSLNNSSFAGHWFTIILIVIIIHATVLWYMFNGVERTHKARSRCRRCLSRLPILLVVFYIVFAFVWTMAVFPILKYTEAIGSPSNADITMDDSCGSEKEWGFGQILPILLLALPALAGWETAFGTKFALICRTNNAN